ncbi:transglycosylase SLT domain-containing protein [Frateuria hangzhouensis]|uniref:transglycosylase SLT domain-containing protein n=1 Tax=Frateuria hangzhouensis TaxID=2995589 RepID=UPI002260CCE1|nr:transglycosylase SLT domain-containing protein [Frateuria sp. STR12]MCX7515118.1 transglycosylase SLT domain-containing protein [Frateuria sp. STR12]
MNRVFRPLPLALSLVLAACATAPAPKAPPPRAEAPAPMLPDAVASAPASPLPPASTTVWERLRGSFEMADCNADPAIDTWARRYTRSPKGFEAQMRRILPRLVYVQESAARHGVPGEFTLLPWVESHFKPVPPRKNRAAGMWQIMPGTARHMGLSVRRDYDGRLDLTTSTDKVMALLKHYHDYFQDWRLADYAYNAGRYGVDRLVNREGAPPAEPAVPTLPVRAGTRAHLVKLMAIACVVREPERFHVKLPTLDADQQLVTVELTRRLSLDDAAQQAGMPRAALADLNAGYRNGVIDTRHGGQLLLPRRHAEQLRTALLAQAVGGPSDRVASVSAKPGLPDLGEEDVPATRQAEHIPAAPGVDSPEVHVVKRGDTLFDIAHHYGVRVTELRQWNHLRGNTIRIGQKLKVGAQD